MSDLLKLEAAEKANRADHIWEVAFTARIPDNVPLAGVDEKSKACPDCGGEECEGLRMVVDTIKVACGDNGQEAINRAEAHVLDSQEHAVQLVDFKVIGLRLMAAAEI